MISKNNLFDFNKLPNKSEIELFTDLFSSNGLSIKRIISNGWNKIDDKWYNQPENEWVLLLKGFATIEFENTHYIQMKEGDYLYIPAHQRHKVINTSSNPPCVWLAVHFEI